MHLLLDSLLSYSFDSDTQSNYIIGILERLFSEELLDIGFICLFLVLQPPESPLKIVFGEFISLGKIGIGLIRFGFKFLAEMLC